MLFKQKKALVITDFDGTICSVDVGNRVLSRFTEKSWEDIDREYVRGSIGSREAYSRIAPLVAANPESLNAFVLKVARIDPFFAKFYRLAQKKGVDVKIVSDGLDFYIRAIMGKHHLEEIEFYSNTVIFGGNDTLTFDFPEANSLCGRCGTCKNKILNDHRLMYEKIIYVGDGHSDICPSRCADFVFAKAVLLRKCEEEGTTPYLPFQDFSVICDYLKKNF
ncbi:MAG: MtnX-like HAD-IB family phosphatase [Deltaproteobacteria bacterium]